MIKDNARKSGTTKNYAIEMMEIGYKNSLQGFFKDDVIDSVRKKFITNDEDVQIITIEKKDRKSGELIEIDVPIPDFYGILESTFNELFQIVYKDEQGKHPSLDLYILKPEYNTHYLSFKQLQDSKKRSTKAVCIAITSMVIAMITSLTSIFISYKQFNKSDNSILIKYEIEENIKNISKKSDSLSDILINLKSIDKKLKK